MTKLLEMLACRYPIIQGPIDAVNSPGFVAAVCEAGAFGMLALGSRNLEEAKKLIREVRALTNKPFGANIMIKNPANPGILEVLSSAGVRVVTTSKGQPDHIYPMIHDAGMRGFHVVLTLQHAMKAAENGADGLVVSGSESGGLRSLNSESSTMVLVPLVVDHVDIPVVAAGGIADSRGYNAAIALGAQGVQIGTRLIASKESPASEKWKDAIVKCGDGDTYFLPLKQGMGMRVVSDASLENKIARNLNLMEEYKLRNALEAWTSGNFDLFPAAAGQSAALVKEIKTVREIVEGLVAAALGR